jgi:GxxExxY protein
VSVIDLEIDDNKLTQAVMDCLFQVHSAMGPGLLESIYEECLAHEFTKRNIAFERQKSIPLVYDGISLASPLKLDFLIEEKIILELKSTEKHNPVYEAQIISYLKLADKKIGFLANFGTPLIKDGVRRFVNKNQSSFSVPPRLRGEKN